MDWSWAFNSCPKAKLDLELYCNTIYQSFGHNIYLRLGLILTRVDRTIPSDASVLNEDGCYLIQIEKSASTVEMFTYAVLWTDPPFRSLKLKTLISLAGDKTGILTLYLLLSDITGLQLQSP